MQPGGYLETEALERWASFPQRPWAWAYSEDDKGVALIRISSLSELLGANSKCWPMA